MSTIKRQFFLTETLLGDTLRHSAFSNTHIVSRTVRKLLLLLLLKGSENSTYKCHRSVY